MTDVDTLHDLRRLAATLLARVDAAIAEHEAAAALRAQPSLANGRTNPAIVMVLSTLGPMKPGDVAERLRQAGRDVTDDAVYQACHRMAVAGTLQREGGRYSVAEKAERKP